MVMLQKMRIEDAARALMAAMDRRECRPHDEELLALEDLLGRAGSQDLATQVRARRLHAWIRRHVN